MSRVVLLLLVALLALPAAASAQETRTGYIPLPDGVELRYTVLLPEGDGPFPVLMQYEGYQAGSNPLRATHKGFGPRMLKKGYAILGVSLRGSACSDGVWELFGEKQAKDGAFAVEWAAKQPWSNGRVATFGYSYGGIMQMWIAAMRPKGLVAATPSNVVADTYRDIGYPGGIYNNVFPPAWGVALQADWALAGAMAVGEGDDKCIANVARNAVQAVPNALAVNIPKHRFDDAWHREHSPGELAERIEVPVLAVRTWQDEETGGRQDSWWEKTDPEKTWLVSSPGNHLVYQKSSVLLDQLEAFFDFHVKGVANGFDRTPRLQAWHETTVKGSNPRSVTKQDRLPARVGTTELYLADGGRLGNTPTTDGRTDYAYPVPSPAVVDTASQGVEETVGRANTWELGQYVAAGRAQYTTPPLARNVTTYGPSSADLWVSTTAKDVDLQVTVSEVRPDGREVWVQRGWLRASHRALDTARSTPLTPFHPHTSASLADMPAGTPQLLRVEIHPFGHTFRKGSSLRIWVEEPSLTGLWGFESIKVPQTVTVHHGAATPSRVVLGVLPDANVEPGLPGCDTLLNIACRANPVPAPSGTLDPVITPPAERTTAATRRLVARFYGRRADRRAVLVRLAATGKRLPRVVVSLRRNGRTVARSAPATVTTRQRSVVLRRQGRARFAAGSYSLVVSSGRTVLLRRAVRLGR